MYHKVHAIKGQSRKNCQLSPIVSAAKSGDLELVAALIEDPKCTPNQLHWGLYMAAEYGHVEIARYLLDHGAVIAHTSYAAATGGHIPMFELFVEYGWDITDPREGNSILRYVILHTLAGLD